MKTSRRRFMQQGAAAVASTLSLRVRGAVRDRPNLLVVLDDQERYPLHLPPLHLPNRERLKKHALEFSHAYCTYPLCSPSRATIMTGRYPHEVGILTNVDFAAKNPPLSKSIPNLANVFGPAGYHTAYFGKWHLNDNETSNRELAGYGFEHCRLDNQLVAIGSDKGVAQDAARWLEKHGARAPWLMVFSPINPHDICFPQFDKLYGGRRDYPVSLPPNFSLSRTPEIQTTQEWQEFWWTKSVMPETENDWLAYLRFYCYLIEDVDKNLGRALDALEASGQGDNTIVVFTSDHGEMGGAHGLAHKGPTMYEENMRVPFLISDPRLSGFRECHEPVTNLDLVPTLCELTGVSWPEPLPGLSLGPLLSGESSLERDAIFGEGAHRIQVAWRGIRTWEWKYFHYVNGEEVLFNIVEDPLEMKNLARDPEAKAELAELRKTVRNFRTRTADPITDFL